jgi:AcrR family transcriptional regulator
VSKENRQPLRTRPRQTPEETRAQIQEAALAFLRDRPYRELNVDSLMSITGHSRTVFYRHFEDVPALVVTLIAEVGGELVEVGQAWGASGRTGPDEAREGLRAFVDFYARNGRLVRAVAEAAQHDERVLRTYSALVETFVAVTESAMRARIDAGEMGPLDAPEISRALVWMLNAYLLDTYGTSAEADRERVLDAVWTIWTRTLFPGG